MWVIVGCLSLWHWRDVTGLGPNAWTEIQPSLLSFVNYYSVLHYVVILTLNLPIVICQTLNNLQTLMVEYILTLIVNKYTICSRFPISMLLNIITKLELIKLWMEINLSVWSSTSQEWTVTKWAFSYKQWRKQNSASLTKSWNRIKRINVLEQVYSHTLSS